MQHKSKETLDAIMSFINSYIEENGNSPSVEEIAIHTGIGKATASRYVSYMREQGIIDYSCHRSIKPRDYFLNAVQTVRVPVLGSVSCGLPKFAEENIEEYVRLPVSLFGRGEYYILRANGESMVEAGIDDGDLVLIRLQSVAEPGQIVVALMEDEATLKRFYPDKKNRRIRLHPENSSMEDIFVEDCIIQGVAVKVLKNLE